MARTAVHRATPNSNHGIRLTTGENVDDGPSPVGEFGGVLASEPERRVEVEVVSGEPLVRALGGYWLVVPFTVHGQAVSEAGHGPQAVATVRDRDREALRPRIVLGQAGHLVAGDPHLRGGDLGHVKVLPLVGGAGPGVCARLGADLARTAAQPA